MRKLKDQRLKSELWSTDISPFPAADEPSVSPDSIDVEKVMNLLQCRIEALASFKFDWIWVRLGYNHRTRVFFEFSLDFYGFSCTVY